MREEFRIGELSARSGLSAHAIRWYEAQGLIPGVVRDGGGRRLYTDFHLGWLGLLDRLRHTGMSIAEMRKYTALAVQGTKTLKQRRELLAAHRARVRERIAEWTSALKLIEKKIAFYEEWLASGERPSREELEKALEGIRASAGARRRPH